MAGQEKKGVYLSIIIPAYNEENRLVQTLLAVDKYLEQQRYSYEILVVNDGSTDNTARVAENTKKFVEHLDLLDNKENHGKGWVVRQGMLAARGKYRLFTDADNSTSIDHIERMWPYFKKGSKVVIGSRDARDAAGARQAVAQPWYRRLIGNAGNLLIQLVAVPGIWDTQNGFKCFEAKAAENIFSRARINRWGFDIEILALARVLGYTIAIIPVFWRNDPRSHVTWKGYFRVFWDLLVIKWNLIRNIYGLKEK